MVNLSGFKRFVIIEEMDPSPEKKMGDHKAPSDDDKMDYFGELGDEMGMEWKDIVHAFSKDRSDGKSSSGSEPWISAHFSLGSPDHEILYKKSAWKIVDMSPEGAVVMLKPQKKDRSYLKGNRLNKGESDKKKYFVPRKELENFLTTGWSPAIQNAQGAAGGMGGGMPGMGGGMPGMGGGMPGMGAPPGGGLGGM